MKEDRVRGSLQKKELEPGSGLLKKWKWIANAELTSYTTRSSADSED